MKKAFLVIVLLLMPVMASQTMKITLKNDVSDELLASLSKVVFTSNSLVATGAYDLSNILKIEFSSGKTGVVNQGKEKSVLELQAGSNIGINLVGDQLSISNILEKDASIYLYNINGQRVANIFSGRSNSQNLNFNLNKYHLGNGVYSVVINTSQSVFVKKVVIK